MKHSSPKCWHHISNIFSNVGSIYPIKYVHSPSVGIIYPIFLTIFENFNNFANFDIVDIFKIMLSGAQLSGAQLSAPKKWTVGPRGPTVRGPTVQGPNCPGPNCPPPKSGQLGPGAQLSGAQLSAPTPPVFLSANVNDVEPSENRGIRERCEK